MPWPLRLAACSRSLRPKPAAFGLRLAACGFRHSQLVACRSALSGSSLAAPSCIFMSCASACFAIGLLLELCLAHRHGLDPHALHPPPSCLNPPRALHLRGTMGHAPIRIRLFRIPLSRRRPSRLLSRTGVIFYYLYFKVYPWMYVPGGSPFCAFHGIQTPMDSIGENEERRKEGDKEIMGGPLFCHPRPTCLSCCPSCMSCCLAFLLCLAALCWTAVTHCFSTPGPT